MKKVTAILLLAVLCPSILGCHNAGGAERHWTEDVRLDDASTIQIERWVVFDETNALGGGTYNAIETKSKLAFKGELSSLPVWDFPWAALVLYKSKQAGNWVIVGTTSSCDVWWRNGKPIPMYWQYELTNGQWTNTPLSPESIGKKTNLFYSYWKNDFPKHVTIAERESRQSDPAISKDYREIVNEAPKGCMDMR